MVSSAEEPSVAESAEALGAYFMGDVGVAEALEKICHASVEAVDPASRAGISMTLDARIGTYVATHPEVATVDQAQYDTGDGPCVDAFATGRAVLVASALEPGPYPEFRRVAVNHGLLSVISMPMSAGREVVGALNLYSPIAHAFGSGTTDRLHAFATHAAFVLHNHQAFSDAQALSENLTQAMASRAVIEQAKGVIMGATGCTPEEAFIRLREQSQQENVKLREIALGIVNQSQRPRL